MTCAVGLAELGPVLARGDRFGCRSVQGPFDVHGNDEPVGALTPCGRVRPDGGCDLCRDDSCHRSLGEADDRCVSGRPVEAVGRIVGGRPVFWADGGFQFKSQFGGPWKCRWGRSIQVYGECSKRGQICSRNELLPSTKTCHRDA